MRCALPGLGLLLAIGCAPGFAAERPLIRERSEVAFTVTQLGVAVTGSFRDFQARIDLDPARPESGSAEISIATSSINTGDEEADAEAVAKSWLDAAGFPKATFRSRALRALGKDRYEVRGELAIKGKSRPLTTEFSLQPQADGALLASGSFTLHRTDFLIGGGAWDESDIVANDVAVRFRLMLGKPKP